MTEPPDRPIFVSDGSDRLAVQSWGHPEGYPVFLMHGMPGSRIGPRPRGIVLERMGIRLISYDRPGYGLSTRQRMRKVVDAGRHVKLIAAKLGIEGRFSVVGRSAGGPHALASAAFLPDTVERVALLVSLAPPDAIGLKWQGGMSTLNVRDYGEVDRELGQAPADGVPANEALDARATEVREDPDSLIRYLMPELSASDRRVVEDRAIRDLLTATYAEAVRRGSGGWIDDAIALRSPWDFKFADVRVPVMLWHGEDDRFSPVAHTRWLAEHLRSHRQGAEKDDVLVRIQDGAAHFAAFEVFTKVLEWLATPYQRAAPAGPRTSVDREPDALGSPTSGPQRLGDAVQSPVPAGLSRG